jgi:hypothetical protein
VLTLGESLQSSEKFYLLHEEITRPFTTAMDELRTDNAECQRAVSTNGAAEMTVDSKSVSPKLQAVRKQVALLTTMLASLSRC